MRNIRWWIRLASFIVVAIVLVAAGLKEDATQKGAQAVATDTGKAKR